MHRYFFSGIFCLFFLNSVSWAEPMGISLGQTRVIFNEEDKAQTISVKNGSSGAYLIQSRIQMAPDNDAIASFIITPPLFVLAGNTSQVMRILPKDDALPSDRESLFYLSVSAIPAQKGPVMAEDRLSVGLRFMLKFFYRPKQLPHYDACTLQFRSVKERMEVSNSSAYFQTLGRLTINNKNVDLNKQPIMVPPGGNILTTLGGPLNKVTWQTLTDYGALSPECRQEE